MNIINNLFPNGLHRCLTMSYDDGFQSDIRLAQIFDEYGIKGTFNLNSRELNSYPYLSDNDVITYLKNHEVAVHTRTHPFLTALPDLSVLYQILDDKEVLEYLCGYIIRGMAYPYGIYDDHVISIAKNCQMEYGRTAADTNDFHVPVDFMKWNPTTHHNNSNLINLWRQFLTFNDQSPLLFMVWGHSFEFEIQNNWSIIEEFCKTAGLQGDIWYATNIPVKDYLTAVNSLILSANQRIIMNPTSIDVWISIDNHPYSIKAGSTVYL